MEHTHTHTHEDFTLVPTVLLYERIIERMKGECSSTVTPVIERLSVIFIKCVVLCVNVQGAKALEVFLQGTKLYSIN